MNILIIGSGGREHALAYALSRSPACDTLYALPGNAGILQIAEKAEADLNDFASVVRFCKESDIGLVVVGPEAPLVAGITDVLEAEGIPVFGPSAAAARLEGSKGFMKDICKKYKIPTAEYRRFDNEDDAKQHIKLAGVPIVVKADGLAAGKGVTVAQTIEEAYAAVDEAFAGKFGEAGKSLVIEEFLEGEEASLFALCDGKNAVLFGSAQDHKAVGEGDTGPNTGGMGTYSPAPVMSEEMHARVMNDIITPTMEAMEAEGAPYKGVLFAGLMINEEGPKLIEFNVRFGDPETQVLMLRLKSDLVDLFVRAAEGNLAGAKVELSDDTALCVVMAAKGYPGEYEKGTEIKGIDKAEALQDVLVFHAGTKQEAHRLLADGGRVLGVTAPGKDAAEAKDRAYEAVARIDWPEGFYRRDIGWRAIKRLGEKV